jgi:ABC-type multidrug transport system fused ATPase/permease subunit
MERNTMMDSQGAARTWDDENADTSQASMGRLFRDLADDLSELTRKEIQLAQTETMEKVSHASKAVISMAIGGFLAYAGLLVLLAAVALALTTFLNLDLWLSALIVGGIVVIVGLITLQSGRSALQSTSITPEKTVDSLKENAAWVKEKIQ